MKTGRALLAVALLAGTLSACDAGDLPNRSSASEGDKALCIYIDRLKVGEPLILAARGVRESSLLSDATDGVLIGVVSAAALNRTLESRDQTAIRTRCREIGAL